MKFGLLFIFLFFSAVVCAQMDTVSFLDSSSCHCGLVKIYDEQKRLRETDWYASANFLFEEKKYEPDGSLLWQIDWYRNGEPWVITQENYFTGRKDVVERDSSGKLLATYELPGDSFDAEKITYFSSGNVSSKGFIRRLNCVEVNERDSMILQAQMETKTGRWKYYYSNGCDSATGNYAAFVFEHDSVFSPPEPGKFMMTGSTYQRDVKDGAWKYFSPEGQLLYTDEWKKGTFIRREENK